MNLFEKARGYSAEKWMIICFLLLIVFGIGFLLGANKVADFCMTAADRYLNITLNDKGRAIIELYRYKLLK